MSERSHHHNPAAHSHSRPTREKGGGPFSAYRPSGVGRSLLIGPPPTANPTISFASACLGNGGSWIAGSRRLPLFPPRKEGQARAELPHREPLTMHANRPLKDIACVLHAQTKDATVVCVIGCQITRTRIHTLPKRLASARHSRVRKLYSYQIHSARFKQTSQWRRKTDDVSSRRHLYCGTPVVTSWAVAGQQVVFFHMYLQTESRWGRSP